MLYKEYELRLFSYKRALLLLIGGPFLAGYNLVLTDSLYSTGFILIIVFVAVFFFDKELHFYKAVVYMTNEGLTVENKEIKWIEIINYQKSESGLSPYILLKKRNDFFFFRIAGAENKTEKEKCFYQFRDDVISYINKNYPNIPDWNDTKRAAVIYKLMASVYPILYLSTIFINYPLKFQNLLGNPLFYLMAIFMETIFLLIVFKEKIKPYFRTGNHAKS